MRVISLGLKLLVVAVMMMWLVQQHKQQQVQGGLQSYPALVADLAALEFVKPYAGKDLSNLERDLSVFFDRYQDTFTFDARVSQENPRVGPLPLLYDLKSRVQHRFTRMQSVIPDDVEWGLVLTNTGHRVVSMLQVYIEDVRERWQLSRYSPQLIQGYYSSRLYGRKDDGIDRATHK